MFTCEICGKPANQYPNAILTHGHAYHVGCLADAFHNLRIAHAKLVQREVGFGHWGPFCDDWEGSFDQQHWSDELYDDRAAKEATITP